MPSSFVRTFTDPDELAESIRKGAFEIGVKQPGNFEAKHTRVDLHRLSVQRFSGTLSTLARAEMIEPRVAIVFLAAPGPGAVRDGVDVDTTKISGFRYDHGYFHQTFGPTTIANFSLSTNDLGCLSETIVGRGPALTNWSLTPLPSAMARLRRLHEAACHLAEDAPAVLAHAEAARGLEQATIEAMLDCLDGDVEEDNAARRKHAAIMRRFHRVVEEHLETPLYVPELCREIGTSVRTLNSCCEEHLGTGPKRYLLLRRMHLARRALRENALTDTRVTEIAARYGFWEFGRFAVEYKVLFGESPSATLARSY